MRIALNFGGIDISQKEFELLAERFAGKTEGHINWREFDEDVESAFGTRHLERKIDAPIADGRTKTFYGFGKENVPQNVSMSHNFVSKFRKFLT